VGSIAFGPSDDVVVGGAFTGGVAVRDGDAWEPLGFEGSVLAVAWGDAIYASTADDGTPGRMILGRWTVRAGPTWRPRSPARSTPATSCTRC